MVVIAPNSTSVERPNALWRRPRCWFRSTQIRIASRSTRLMAQRRLLNTFYCSSAKNDSIAALSSSAPTRPIDLTRPCRSNSFRNRLE